MRSHPMKHIYIISIILSSFFTYKTVSANITSQQYAFFIPGGAFQQNQKVQDIRLMRPRYTQPDETSENQLQQNTSTSNNNTLTSQKTTIAEDSSSTSISSQASLENKKRSTFPITKNATAPLQPIKKQTKTNTPQTLPSTNIVFKDETPKSISVSPETKQKLEQYRLDENTQIAATKENSSPQPLSQLSDLEKLKQKSLSSLLKAIPYPDSSLPKFKQLYSYYGMELRVYQRRGKFPSNREQEETLAKANSIKRFEVQ